MQDNAEDIQTEFSTEMRCRPTLRSAVTSFESGALELSCPKTNETARLATDGPLPIGFKEQRIFFPRAINALVDIVGIVIVVVNVSFIIVVIVIVVNTNVVVDAYVVVFVNSIVVVVNVQRISR